MASYDVHVLSGFTVSSAVAVQGGKGLTVVVASHAGLGWAVTVAEQLTGPFHELARADGTGLPWTVWSGAAGGAGVVPIPPLAIVRVEASAATTDTTSVRLFDTARG